MDRRTVDAYEGPGAERYRRERTGSSRAADFGASVVGWRADLGCGPGHDTAALGAPLLSLDASFAMTSINPSPHRVQADLCDLPVRRGALAGAWASKSYQHIPHGALPLALADLQRSIVVGASIELTLFPGAETIRTDDDDSFPGRLFSLWEPSRLAEVVHGAGFDDVTVDADEHRIVVRAVRARMLPDLVKPGLRVLVCGYNPSLYAADTGIAFARPGNRFWPAALAAGLVSVDRDPWHAVRHHDVGWTDLVKRASVAAAELTTEELHAGLERVERICDWLRPATVCLLGVGGWRSLVGRRAVAGWQERTLGGSPVYVMPNPSGLNASTQHEGYVAHLTEVVRRASRPPATPGTRR